MNVKEFYNKLLKIFPRENLMVDSFINPAINNYNFSHIQFIYPNGAIYPPLDADADTILFATPLEGPFYRLPVVGAIMGHMMGYDDNSNWWYVKVVVRLPNGKLTSSCSIHIYGNKENIKKEIGCLCGNNWYKIRSLNSRPFKYELVQDSII